MNGNSATANEPPSAGIFKRCVVYLFAALAIGCLAVITFAGATEFDNGVTVYMGWGSLSADYLHGWPWCFCHRACSMSDPWVGKRIALWNDPTRFYLWALIGDVVVFVFGVAVVIVLARRAVRRAGWRFTLARGMVLIGAACAALGYAVSHRQLRLQEQMLLQESFGHDYWWKTRYCGPRWLLHLVGNSCYLSWFEHYTGVNASDDDLNWLQQHVDQFKYLRRIEFSYVKDDDVGAFLRSRKRWNFEEIYFNGDGAGGLAEIRHCPRVKSIDAHDGSSWELDNWDEIVAVIAAQCPLLEECCVDANDAGLRQLSQCRRLRSLWINGPISDDALASLTNCPDLEVLVLQNTQLTERSIETFRRLPRLKRLYITAPAEHTQVLGALVDELKIDDASVIKSP